MRAYLRVTAWYAVLWWMLARGDERSLVFGAIVLAGAVATARARGTASVEGVRVRWRRLPWVVAFFVVHSLRGGVDVARRALSRHPDLSPAFLRVPVRVTGAVPRTLVALTVNLIPGTLTARLDETSLIVHVLDARRPIERDVDRVQGAVASLFAQPFPDEPAS